MKHLFSNLEKFSTNIALITETGERLSYQQLAEQADAQCATMAGSPGLLALETSTDLPSILTLVGACRVGCPVLLVAPGTLAASPELQLTFQADYLYRGKSDNFKITKSGYNSQPGDYHPDLALLLSTSGSAGSSKLVRLSQRNLIANAHSIIEYLALNPSERAITTLPLHYSFGFSILSSHLLCGASLVCTSSSVLDENLWKQIRTHQVTSLSGVPRTYEILSSNEFFERQLPSLKTLTQAGGKLKPELVHLFAKRFSENGKRFFVMYGQTEAAPRISFVPPDLLLENTDSIGQPIPGGSIELIDDTGNRIDSTDTAGELVFRGENVMMGYATGRAELTLPQGSDQLRTGDIAVRKPNGLFKIVGRASRFLKIAGLRIGLDEVENQLAKFGCPAFATGDDSHLVIACEHSTTETNVAIANRLRQRLQIPQNCIQIVRYSELPYLTSGKPDYVGIRKFAASEMSECERDDLRERLTLLLQREAIEDSESFNTAGGDSLNYIEANFLVEAHFGKAKPGWEQMPFAQLFATELKDSSETATKSSPLDPIFIARSIAISLAMVSHAFLQFGFFRFSSG